MGRNDAGGRTRTITVPFFYAEQTFKWLLLATSFNVLLTSFNNAHQLLLKLHRMSAAFAFH